MENRMAIYDFIDELDGAEVYAFSYNGKLSSVESKMKDWCDDITDSEIKSVPRSSMSKTDDWHMVRAVDNGARRFINFLQVGIECFKYTDPAGRQFYTCDFGSWFIVYIKSYN